MDRLPYDGSSEAEVFQYFSTRALQLAPNGLTWCRTLTSHPEGFTTHFTDGDGDVYDSFFVPTHLRGERNGYNLVKRCANKIITVDDCGIINFLLRIGVDFCVETGVFDSVEYSLIEQHYQSKRARRSGVLLMNHIDEGLYVLHQIGASDVAKRAFCLHPLLQTDAELQANLFKILPTVDSESLVLAMEYRNIANQWLSDKVNLDDCSSLVHSIVQEGQPRLSPLDDVNHMLVADKVQNYKDFLLYHKNSHPRSDQLETYFQTWLQVLKVDNIEYWIDTLSTINPPRLL